MTDGSELLEFLSIFMINARSMKNILITSAGRRVSLVRAFSRELKQYFENASVFTAELKPNISPACQVSDGFFELPRVTSKNYIEELLRLALKLEVGMLVPTIDTELAVLAENRALFSESGIEVVVSDLGFVNKCRDKRKIHGFFEEHNIPVPAAIDKHSPRFPLFVKPYDGSCSVDIYLIENEAQLSQEILSNERLLFMEAVDRKNYEEFTIDLYYNSQGQLRCVVPRKRLETRAGEVSKGLTVRNTTCDFVKQNLSLIPGARGCLTLQLFRRISSVAPEEPDFYGIEINPRFGGGYPLSYLAGANFPKWLIEEYFLDIAPTYFEDWEENLLMLRYDDEVLVHDYQD